MRLQALAFALFGTTLLCAQEPSAFGDGSYALSETEKLILSNKRASLQNSRQIKALKMRVEQLQEQLEGLRSVVGGMSDKIGKMDRKIAKRSTQESDTQTTGLEALQKQIEEMKEEQKRRNKEVDTLLKKLGKMIGKLASASTVPTPSPKAHTAQKQKRESNPALMKRAIAAFRKKKYDTADTLFEQLDTAGYKPAKSSYYLGEISYYRGRYSDAIVYYKKSAQLQDKASYMPTLMLHTAISFEKVGDKENARRFFQALIESYPETRQAKIAHAHLK